VSLLRERIYKALNEKNAVQRYLSRKFFKSLESIGFHVLGDHFYEPIPNTKEIAKNYQHKPRSCHHIDFNFDRAEQKIVQLLDRWGGEFFASVTKYGYQEINYYFRGVDALFLYCFLREIQPKSIVEVGQGVSTSITLAALEDNYKATGIKTKFISIDPYNRFDFNNKTTVGIELEAMPVDLQTVPLTLFSDLGESDLLFVDSSHVYKFGSDVEYVFEEIYPNTGKGVYIHVHDICSPYHYPLHWYVTETRFWNEQYYLENFLRFNSKFEVEMPIYYLIQNSKVLAEKLNVVCKYNDFQPIGYSFYMKRIG
jgi:Methyltransferase domain